MWILTASRPLQPPLLSIVSGPSAAVLPRAGEPVEKEACTGQRNQDMERLRFPQPLLNSRPSHAWRSTLFPAGWWPNTLLSRLRYFDLTGFVCLLFLILVFWFLKVFFFFCHCNYKSRLIHLGGKPSVRKNINLSFYICESLFSHPLTLQ